MQVQNQTQQIAEEEFLLPLSEDELASIAGGDAPPGHFPPEPHILSNEELDAIRRRLVASPRLSNPLDVRRAQGLARGRAESKWRKYFIR